MVKGLEVDAVQIGYISFQQLHLIEELIHNI